jgi:hypothetical protein
MVAGVVAVATALVVAVCARCSFPPDVSAYPCELPDTLPIDDGGACPLGYAASTSVVGLCLFKDRDGLVDECHCEDCSDSVGRRSATACNGFPDGSWPVCPPDGGADGGADGPDA